MSRREPLPPGPRERVADRRSRADRLVRALANSYPDAACALHYETPFQLLVATILSAQCTDARVNEVTPALFAAFPTSAALAAADVDDVAALVRPTGFYRQKARNIVAAAQRIEDAYDGAVPEVVDELVTLAGVARKTANVVVSNCFPENATGIAVDTHVQRIARRLGLVRAWAPTDVERELVRLLDRGAWNALTHLLIDHGRAVCRAPTPRCSDCPPAIAAECPSRARWTVDDDV